MRKIKLRSGMLVIAAVLMASSALAADNRLAAIKEAGVLRIGTTGDYKPFSYKGSDGVLTGADISEAKAFAASIGVKPEFVMTTWKTMLPDFKADKFDMAVGGVSINPERSEVGTFSIPNMTDGKRPIVRCSDKEKYTSLQAIDQPQVHVIVNPGGTNDTFAHQHLDKATIEVFPDNKTVFDEIAAGKADVMVTDGVEVDLQSKLHPGVLCPADVKEPFTHSEKAYFLQKDDPALKQALDAFMKKEIDSGDWKKKLDAAMH